MKIGIITQPLRNNYGGLVQNYALQQVLMKLGHNVVTLDQTNVPISRIRIMTSYLKTIILKLLGKCDKRRYDIKFIKAVETISSKNTKSFVDKYIYRTPPMYKTSDFRSYCINNNITILITGSDQVWRPLYNYNIYRSFFDFAEGLNIKKYAYAASFGVDTWEYTEEQTLNCKRLLESFDAISVREHSGIDLCKTYLNCTAEYVLDPTMLLNKEDYEEIIINENEQPISSGNLFTYILDESEEKKKIVGIVSNKLGLVPFAVMPKCRIHHSTSKQINDYIYPPVTRWLRAFMDSEYVVCDSFHGAVFSIIFNKPFLVIGNKERGMARFNSLLQTFGLSNRMITSHEQLESIISQPICWQNVNKIREQLKSKSFQFLTEKLDYNIYR